LVAKAAGTLGLGFGLVLALVFIFGFGLEEPVYRALLVVGEAGLAVSVLAFWEFDTVRQVRLDSTGVTFSHPIHDVKVTWSNLEPTGVAPDHGRWALRLSQRNKRRRRFQYVSVPAARAIIEYPAHPKWELSVDVALALSVNDSENVVVLHYSSDN
jgi:hypothetical protein